MSILNPRDISTLPWYYDEFGKYFIFNLSRVVIYIFFSQIVVYVKLKLFNIYKLLGIVLRII